MEGPLEEHEAVHELIEEPTEGEVLRTISRLKNNMASGKDGSC